MLFVYVLLYRCARTHLSTADSGLVVLLFVAHPIGYILSTWIGMVDCVTILLTIPLLFLNNPILLGLSSSLLMANHTAAPFIALPLLTLRWVSGDGVIRKYHVVAGAIGIFLGKLGTVAAFHVAGIEPATRLQGMLSISLKHLLTINIEPFPLIIYAMHFGIWAPVLLMVSLFFKTNRKLYSTYVILLAVFMALPFSHSIQHVSMSC